MKLLRRKFLRLAAGAAALPVLARIAQAQTYPNRPVRIIVGFAPGSASDILTRLIGQSLSERLGQPFVIENRGGAGGSLGTEMVVRASPDGYTLVYCSSADCINMTIYDKLNFVFLRDIAPVASFARGPLVLVVHPSFPAKTLPEFITYAKANPGKVNFASAGIGTVVHMAGELFESMASVNLLHIPYRGLGPAVTDLLGGQVQSIFSTTPPSIEHVRTGKLRALAVTSATRFEALPDLPTIGDFLPGYEATLLSGFGAPRNVPAEVVDRLNKEINAIIADPGMKARLADLGNEPVSMTSADFGKVLADETAKWAKVIRAANIKAG
ncbi:MAG: tripartite tricarboxylate transporter substrate binding protein [Pseudolabrys sp.]|nr:tripartite tricarboxylate transporter substrate binding protein [Pseudolabrys sp.]